MPSGLSENLGMSHTELLYATGAALVGILVAWRWVFPNNKF